MAAKICLIVDDEPSIRTYLKGILGREHFVIIEAENAPQAFRSVEKLNGSVDLLITDIQMPGDMNGVDLAWAVRQAYPEIPVLLISGYNATEQQIDGFPFIQKPFRPEAILNLVNRLAASPKSQVASV